MEARIGHFNGRDGTKLYYEQWNPPEPKAGIVFVHGVGDHCGRYGPFAHYFLTRSYRVCFFDQRGHGKSEGKRAHVDDFESLYHDLEDYIELCRQGGPATMPWFIAGHSLGGQIVINFLARFPDLFRAAVVSSPNIEIAMTMPGWMEKVSRKMVGVMPTMKLQGFVHPGMLSHDPKIVAAYKKDPLVSSYITIKIGIQILKNLEEIFSLCTKIKTPLLMLHGSADKVCSPEGTKRFYRELILAQKELKIYEGMYHELFNEIKREEVFHDVESWLDRFGV